MGCGASSPFQTKAPGDTNISWTPATSSAAVSVTASPSPTAKSGMVESDDWKSGMVDSIRRKAPVESRSSSSVGRGMSRYPHLHGRLVRTRSATADASAPVLGSLAMMRCSTRCAGAFSHPMHDDGVGPCSVGPSRFSHHCAACCGCCLPHMEGKRAGSLHNRHNW